MALWQISCALLHRQAHVAHQPGGQLLRREQLHLCSRQFQRQRQPIQLHADSGHGQRIGASEREIGACSPGACDE